MDQCVYIYDLPCVHLCETNEMTLGKNFMQDNYIFII